MRKMSLGKNFFAEPSFADEKMEKSRLDELSTDKINMLFAGGEVRIVKRPRRQFFTIRASQPANNIYLFFPQFVSGQNSTNQHDDPTCPPPQPIRLQDLLNSARSRSEKENERNYGQSRLSNNKKSHKV